MKRILNREKVALAVTLLLLVLPLALAGMYMVQKHRWAQDRLAELDPDREVIAYCRGAYCVFAFEAVAALRAQGRPARRLVDGFPEWKAAGLPVATSF